MDVMKEKCSSMVRNCNGYINDLPQALKDKVDKFIRDKGLSRTEEFMRLAAEYKYFSCLAEPGEPVGVIAAQSVGEPSTQMT